MELLTLPQPVTVKQLQTELLRPGEVLLSFVVLPEQTVTLAVSRDRFVLQTLPLTANALRQRIRTVRASLNPPAHGDPVTVLERLDPTDLYTLYRDLIAPVEPLLNDAKRLLVVADDALYGLPLEMLLSRYDDAQRAAFRAARSKATGRPGRPLPLAEYQGLSYLGERYTFRYLPSLAALASQRRYPKPAIPLTRPLIAFADPVFDPQEDPPTANTATSATRSYTPATQQTLALLTRSGATDGTLARLPETADEARALAAAIPGPAQLYLRRDAQERTVKDLARAGDLKGLHYLLFATHGLLAGDFRPPEPTPDANTPLRLDQPLRTAPREPLGQPALALTLVDPAHGEDGLLTFKEVIEDLDLNVDLAILSACNTVGDHAKTTTGEGFAGLTRAFLFAGARHLWVSHWAVDSAATRDLTTAAVRALQAGQTDPATALAQAQKALRDQPPLSASPAEANTNTNTNTTPTPRPLARAHPFFWAPFVTVGD